MKKALLLIGICLLFACNNDIHQGYHITVNFKAPEPKINIKKIVPLETTKSSLYGSFFRVCISENYIYIQDMQQVIVFDLTGQYLSKIHAIGSGPQEYIAISQFWVFDDEIYITASEKKAILVYAPTGQYLRTIPLDFSPNAVAVTPDYMAFKSTYNPNGTLIITDRQGTKKYETVKPVLASVTVSIPAVFSFIESKRQLYYFPDFSSDIYSIGPSATDVKKIGIDFGEHAILPEYIASLTQNDMMERLKKDKIMRFPALYMAGPWWGMTFYIGEMQYAWYYNTENKQQRITAGKGNRAVKPIAAASHDLFVKTVEAAEFLRSPEYATFRDSISVQDDDNALLVFYSVN